MNSIIRENRKRCFSVEKRIQVTVDAIVAPVEPVFNGHGAHAALAPVTLYLAREVAFRAKEQLPTVFLIAGARPAILLTNALIFRAIFNEHLFTRPYTHYN
jgi:hypothetical protein